MVDSPQNPILSAITAEMEAVYSFYAAMAPEMDAENGAGGKLLYVGEPDADGCRLLRAANIAGAASIAVCADAAVLRKAMREGAIDFVVNSLDEALRILKNQIRKKQPVAVGVVAAPDGVLEEMLARGVQPDLFRAELATAPNMATFVARGARRIEMQSAERRCSVISISPDWTRPASEFDSMLVDSLDPGDSVNRRWLRLSSRYLPAECRRLRLVIGEAKGLGIRD